MRRQIRTSILDRNLLLAELDEIVRYFGERGWSSCGVLFGPAWGSTYYPGSQWEYEETGLSRLRQKVNDVEATRIGSIGNDDLFIRIGVLEFLLCHECDVHVCFDEPDNSDVEAFFARWQKLGYAPSEWVGVSESGRGERVR